MRQNNTRSIGRLRRDMLMTMALLMNPNLSAEFVSEELGRIQQRREAAIKTIQEGVDRIESPEMKQWYLSQCLQILMAAY